MERDGLPTGVRGNWCCPVFTDSWFLGSRVSDRVGSLSRAAQSVQEYVNLHFIATPVVHA